MDEWTGIQMDRLMDYGAPDGGEKMDEWLSRWTDKKRQFDKWINQQMNGKSDRYDTDNWMEG